MRYQPGHKAEIHQKIVKDAAQRVRAEGLNGAAVSAVMRDSDLTHGGFYKHFARKDELLIESLKEGFREIIDTLVRAAQAYQNEASHNHTGSHRFGEELPALKMFLQPVWAELG